MSKELASEILNGPLALDGLKLRLAAQVAPRRWRRPLESLAQAIDGGDGFEVAFERQQVSHPRELRCLIAESFGVPDPTQLILDAIRIRHHIGRDWYELIQLMIYPLMLFGLALVVGCTFNFLTLGSPDFSVYDFYEDIGLRGIEPFVSFINDQFQAIIGLTLVCGWTLLVLLTIALIGPRWGLSTVVGGMLLIGQPLRWILMREILQRYELFIAQGVKSVVAAEAVARTFQHSSQSVAARAIAGRIQAGIPLGQSLCLSLLSDGLARPALRMLDLRGSEMPRALSDTAELLGNLTAQRCRGLTMLLPIFSILFVGSIVWATVAVYLLMILPMISMITSLA